MLLRNEGELIVIAEVVLNKDDLNDQDATDTPQGDCLSFSITSVNIGHGEFPVKVITIKQQPVQTPFGHFQLVGPYLVAKKLYNPHPKLYFTKLDLDECSLIKTVEREWRSFTQSEKPNRAFKEIDLSDWMGKINWRTEHLHFSRVPKSSHWHIRSRIQGHAKMDYYENLLQVNY